MTKTYTQVIKQIEQLQRQADKLRGQEAKGVIARIKEAIAFYDLAPGDLFDGVAAVPAKAARQSGKKVAAKKAGKAEGVIKFRDEAGHTWSGRGPRPKWLREALASGKQLQDLAA